MTLARCARSATVMCEMGRSEASSTIASSKHRLGGSYDSGVEALSHQTVSPAAQRRPHNPCCPSPVNHSFNATCILSQYLLLYICQC